MNKMSSTPAVGASSLLVIFAVLCLTVFALLSLSTVQADKRLADAATGAALAYYEADTEAERIFACLRGGQQPEGVTAAPYTGIVDGKEISGMVYSYICPISDTQAIEVEVCCQDGAWSVLCWRAVSTVEWSGDDSITIWDGDGIF